MLHSLRILMIGVVVVGVTSQSLQPRVLADERGDACEYQQRRDAFAGQLESLRAMNPVISSGGEAETLPSLPGVVDIQESPEQRRLKEAMLVDALDSLITHQTENRRHFTSYQAVESAAVMLSPLSDHSGRTPREMVGYYAADMPATESEAAERAEATPDSADDGVPAEAEGPEPPLPPAPRVRATEATRESQESLVRQMRGLMEAVSVSVSPADMDLPIEMAPDAPPLEPEHEITMDARPAPMRPQAPYTGDPLEQLVDLDFREVDLTNVVAILAMKADINIMAGDDLRGTVTANFRQVPLRVAMEAALRQNGLGLVEEEGIFYIVPYQEAASVNRKTTLVSLEKAEARDVVRILEDIVSGIRDEAAINISADQGSNTVVISAPRARVDELVAMAHQLDVAEQVLPTITEAIALNYSDPSDMMPLIERTLSERFGSVAGDRRARQIVVTDLPVVIEQVRELVKKLDVPTKQVLIETMVVDAVLSDAADTGVQWLLDSVRRMSRRQQALGEDGRAVGNLQELFLNADMRALDAPAGLLGFSVLSDKIDWSGLIQAEVRNRNAHLVSNPVLLTLENEAAHISISQEIPYQELQQTAAGGQMTSTSFKNVGTVLSVTPRVTHDNTIIAEIDGKESTVVGDFQGIPIEDMREIQTTMRMGNGQTIFVGGLRKSNDISSSTKIPILGDLPLVNFMFRTRSRNEQINELMVFLTCNVIDGEHPPRLTGYEQDVYEKAPPIVPRVDAWDSIKYDIMNPHATKDMQHRWRRGT